MWTRELIKTRAKEVLKINYWKAFVVSLIIVIAGGGRGSGGGNGGRDSSNRYGNLLDERAALMLSRILSIVLTVVLVLFVLRLIVGYMLEVGGRKFFIKAAEGKTDMGYLGYCFKEGRYVKVLLTMLLRDVYLVLWFLLLIIPGIVKSYSYRMVPYILADNPNIGYSRAIELSNQMTNGEKWNMFVLDLSFIGWYLLGIIALGIGILFVQPYYDSTESQLYLILRENAINRGLSSFEELSIER